MINLVLRPVLDQHHPQQPLLCRVGVWWASPWWHSNCVLCNCLEWLCVWGEDVGGICIGAKCYGTAFVKCQQDIPEHVSSLQIRLHFPNWISGADYQCWWSNNNQMHLKSFMQESPHVNLYIHCSVTPLTEALNAYFSEMVHCCHMRLAGSPRRVSMQHDSGRTGRCLKGKLPALHGGTL